VCLYCNAFEYCGLPMYAYGNGERGLHLTLQRLLWADDVVLFTDGEELVATEHERRLLEEYGIEVVEIPLKRHCQICSWSLCCW